MKEFKVKVGEWPFDHFIEDQNGTTIATLRMRAYSSNDKTLLDALQHCDENLEVVEHAQLMAAAPDLLEALQKIVDSQYSPSRSLANLNGDISNAKDVIKKALGQ